MKQSDNVYRKYPTEDLVYHFRVCYKNRHGVNAKLIRESAKNYLRFLKERRKPTTY